MLNCLIEMTKEKCQVGISRLWNDYVLHLYYYNAPVLKFEFHSHYRPLPRNTGSLLTVDFTPSDGCKLLDSSLLVSRSFHDSSGNLPESSTSLWRSDLFFIFKIEGAGVVFPPTPTPQLVHPVAIMLPSLVSHILTTVLSSSSLHHSFILRESCWA
jgi:hypothetical protein